MHACLGLYFPVHEIFLCVDSDMLCKGHRMQRTNWLSPDGRRTEGMGEER